MYSREIYKEKVENNGINIWRLLEFIICRWKIVAGISAILFIAGIVVLLLSFKNNDSEVQSIEMEQLTESQQYKVDSILKSYEELKQMEDYKNNSAYMNLNAYECNSTVLQYLVTDTDPNKNSFDIYKVFARDGKLKEKIESEFGNEIVMPSDLLIISEGARSNMLMPDTKNDILNVKIVTSDADLNKRITDTVKEAFDEYHQYILSEIGEHKISLLGENSYVGVDKTVEAVQDSFKIEFDRTKAQITSLESQLTSEEKEVLDRERDHTDNEMEVVQQNKTFPWKWSVVILVLCVMVSVVMVSCYYILNGRIKSNDEIVSLFGIPYVGKFITQTNDEKNKLLESCIELLCAELKEKRICLLLVGNRFSKIESHMDLMKTNLEDKGIEVIVGMNAEENPNELKKAKECGNIVLVFEINKTSYNSIDRFLQQCNTYGINVVGAIDVVN